MAIPAGGGNRFFMRGSLRRTCRAPQARSGVRLPGGRRAVIPAGGGIPFLMSFKLPRARRARHSQSAVSLPGGRFCRENSFSISPAHVLYFVFQFVFHFVFYLPPSSRHFPSQSRRGRFDFVFYFVFTLENDSRPAGSPPAGPTQTERTPRLRRPPAGSKLTSLRACGARRASTQTSRTPRLWRSAGRGKLTDIEKPFPRRQESPPARPPRGKLTALRACGAWGARGHLPHMRK